MRAGYLYHFKWPHTSWQISDSLEFLGEFLGNGDRDHEVYGYRFRLFACTYPDDNSLNGEVRVFPSGEIEEVQMSDLPLYLWMPTKTVAFEKALKAGI